MRVIGWNPIVPVEMEKQYNGQESETINKRRCVLSDSAFFLHGELFPVIVEKLLAHRDRGAAALLGGNFHPAALAEYQLNTLCHVA